VRTNPPACTGKHGTLCRLRSANANIIFYDRSSLSWNSSTPGHHYGSRQRDSRALPLHSLRWYLTLLHASSLCDPLLSIVHRFQRGQTFRQGLLISAATVQATTVISSAESFRPTCGTNASNMIRSTAKVLTYHLTMLISGAYFSLTIFCAHSGRAIQKGDIAIWRCQRPQ